MHRLLRGALAGALLVVAILALPGVARAVAHHNNVLLQKLRGADGKVSGFRIHGVLVPETYKLVRLNVGKMSIDPTLGIQHGSTDHRLLAAGIKPGYVRAQLQEFDVGKMQGAGGMYEFKLDVHYGVMNDLKPGDKVDIYTTHSAAGGASYWHVFGMHQGPVNQNDMTHVHDLPSDTSAHGEATNAPPSP